MIKGPAGPSGATASVATQTANGLMSKEDKKKLDRMIVGVGNIISIMNVETSRTEFTNPSFTIPTGAKYYQVLTDFVEPSSCSLLHRIDVESVITFPYTSVLPISNIQIDRQFNTSYITTHILKLKIDNRDIVVWGWVKDQSYGYEYERPIRTPDGNCTIQVIFYG